MNVLPTPTPYTVITDTREQRNYNFFCPLEIEDNEGETDWDGYDFVASLPGKTKRETFTIRTQVGTLATGEYSIAGFEDRMAVERKAVADLFGTLGKGRERFVRELERLSAMEFAAVVVEAEWSTIITTPPQRSKLHPRSIVGSVIAWQVRYPKIHWAFLPGRDFAEAYTARLLDKWWREHQPINRPAAP